jgi:hypothetical protein
MTVSEDVNLSYLREQMRIPSLGFGLRAPLSLERRLGRSKDRNEIAHVEIPM